MLLTVDCLPNAVGKQPFILLIDLGRKWMLTLPVPKNFTT